MSSTSGNTPAGQGGGTAFNTLAGYLFGKNETSEKMKMTTPVFSDNGGKMQFVVQARQVCTKKTSLTNSATPPTSTASHTLGLLTFCDQDVYLEILWIVSRHTLK